MNFWQKIIISAVLIVIILLAVGYFLSEPETVDYESISLNLMNQIPDSESDQILASPVSYAFSNDAFFVADQQRSKIVVFDYEGNFLREIGRQGSGPNEFMMLGNITYHNNHLYVNDFGNGRFTQIDLNNDSMTSVFPEKLPSEFVVNDEGIYVKHLLSEQSDEADIHLISHYDFEMNVINQFGHYLSEEVYGMTPGGSAMNMKVYDNKLYVLFEYYPILKVFSLEGDLIESITLSDVYGTLTQTNYSPGAYTNPSYLDLRSVFGGFVITEKDIITYTYDEDYMMDVFTHEGVLKKRIERSESLWLMDMHFIKESDDTYNLYLGSFDPPRLSIFSGRI